MSSKENTISCSRRDFLRGLGRRFFPGAGRLETNADMRQGREFFEQDNYFMAARCFRTFLENTSLSDDKNDQQDAARSFLGVSLYWCGRTDEALTVFEGIGETPPRNLVLLYTGLCLASEGRTEAALDVLKAYKDFSRPLVQRAVNTQLALREEKLPITARELEQDIRLAIKREKEPLRWERS